MNKITFIYLITNINGNCDEVYIGKSIDPNRRKSTHRKKLGNKIEFTIIDQIDSLDRSKWEPLETYWIQQMKSWGFKILNVKEKGGSGVEFHREESKVKSRNSAINVLNKNPELKIQRGKNQTKTYIENPEIITNRNLKHSKTLKDKNIREQIGINVSKTKKGKRYKNKLKPVTKYNLNNEELDDFDSVKDAANSISVSPICITRCCQGLNKTSKGYIWKYKISR